MERVRTLLGNSTQAKTSFLLCSFKVSSYPVNAVLSALDSRLIGSGTPNVEVELMHGPTPAGPSGGDQPDQTGLYNFAGLAIRCQVSFWNMAK